MKYLFVAGLFALVIAGCDRNNPTAVSSDNSPSTLSSGNVAFSESVMVTNVVTSDPALIMCDSSSRDSVRHIVDSLRHTEDSLRQVRMLGLLKDSLGLSDAQIDSIKLYAQTLSSTLESIHAQVRDSSITRDQAVEMVKAARDQFIASIQSVLTADQLALFDRWIYHFWNCDHRPGEFGGGPRGPEGPGHHDGDDFGRGLGRH